ncbi:IDLSRF-like peptide isoform X1 [Penaeus vannamei]|uniref:IDLSRF-like peptide isoform X1 n=1 Tax=Penaeus vannamei TaxID=6689 RepID=UPI00387FA6C3
MGRLSSSHGHVMVLVAVLGAVVASASAIDISHLEGHRQYTKRSAYGYGYNPRQDYRHEQRERECAAYEPFRCPGGHVCISIQYLCDGAPDCPDGYDENLQLCTAAKRPPVEETASFLQSLLASHGPNYLEKLFGTKARNALKPLGGVQQVAVALSESQTIDEFGRSLNLMKSDVEHLRSVFMAVENGDIGMLKSLGIKDSELGDVKFFLEKLVNTGFLD